MIENTLMNKPIRTRFAPSPTGALHIGSIRTALFAYLFARHNKGQFVLRIEDTDRARFVDGAIEQIISIMQRMGLNYDEGIFFENNQLVSKGDFGPYLQSERLEIYHEHAKKLIEAKYAYYCFCDEQRLSDLRKEQEALKLAPMYDRKCRNLSKEEVQKNLDSGMPHVVRQAIPEAGKTEADDLVYGHITWENKLIDDQVLLKSDGFPTYFLAVVVDDHLMQISHVVRGEEWLPSTPKHVLLYKAFGWNVPIFAHLPIVLNKDRSKLSKRQGDVAAQDFLDKGYLEEALLNFLVLLGWNPKTEQEIFILDELIEQFDFSKVNKAAPVFDIDKLDWLNGLYLRSMDSSKLTELLVPYLVAAGHISYTASIIDKNLPETFLTKTGKTVSKDFIVKIVEIEKERLKKLSEIGDRVQFFFETPKYDPSILIWRKSNLEKTKENLSELLEALKEFDENIFSSRNIFEEQIKKFIAEKGLDNGSVLWPLRVALSGSEFSPSPFEITEILYLGYGKYEVLERIDAAIKALA
jgi:nondiscriminating glutamyl-tRNA synthetase